IRPWTLVAFHCLGSSYDTGTLRKHRGLISVPTDENGHNPIRWNVGVRYLTAWGVSQSYGGMHFGISRKGDYLASVDLNDIAYVTAGTRAFGNYGFNASSIGFELEAHEARKYPDGTKTSRIYRQPYPDRQLLCLAVALRKINSWRPVINFTYLATGQEVIAARNAKSGGMFQHFTIAYPSRTDPGAQFNIPPGQKASFGSPMWNGEGGPNVGSSRGNGPVMRSGWDQLEEIYNKLRGVNPATEVFQKPVTPTALALAKATSLIARSSNPGQSAALRRGRNAVAALSRSEGMQGQTRREMYSRAAANNASLAGLLAKAGNTAGIIAQRFDLSGIRGVAGAELYDYETGLWKKSDETS
ncbi:N-acetylmuramoyl-L-alanine amidase, partial [Patescibacteria group bacterium]|nr:N-acetylmuramoyl-L-alanine amidase [Patescibacteria group bacterium]